MEPLLHLETNAGWRAVLAAGGIDAPPGGFVHLSTPTQVAYPAGYLYAGRGDIVLLVLDPHRLVDVRFEDGDPPHPQGWQFPHAYAGVPASAVLAAVPYRPGADGGFAAPGHLPVTVAERAAMADLTIRRRASAEEVPVTGGAAVRTPGFERRWSSNFLHVTGAATAEEIERDADWVLGGWGIRHRVAHLYGERLAGTAEELRERGWTVDAEVTMAARPAPGTAAGVERVDPVDLLPFWTATRRARYPDIDDAEVRQMLDGHAADAAVADVRFLAVRAGAETVAATVLKIDGATAVLGPLDTLPEARRRGHGNALVTAASDLALRAGCDLLALDALADDWPRHWYARRGFAEVARCWAAYRAG